MLEHADRGRRFLADFAMRHSYGSLSQTLTSLLDEVNAPLAINLLSLNVDGNKLAVLQRLDFQRYKPKSWWIQEAQRLANISRAVYRLCSRLFDYVHCLNLLFSRNDESGLS